jgi:hypothetical protein
MRRALAAAQALVIHVYAVANGSSGAHVRQGAIRRGKRRLTLRRELVNRLEQKTLLKMTINTFFGVVAYRVPAIDSETASVLHDAGGIANLMTASGTRSR